MRLRRDFSLTMSTITPGPLDRMNSIHWAYNCQKNSESIRSNFLSRQGDVIGYQLGREGSRGCGIGSDEGVLGDQRVYTVGCMISKLKHKKKTNLSEPSIVSRLTEIRVRMSNSRRTHSDTNEPTYISV